MFNTDNISNEALNYCTIVAKILHRSTASSVIRILLRVGPQHKLRVKRVKIERLLGVTCIR